MRRDQKMPGGRRQRTGKRRHGERRLKPAMKIRFCAETVAERARG